jgi:hypothetical protein
MITSLVNRFGQSFYQTLGIHRDQFYRKPTRRSLVGSNEAETTLSVAVLSGLPCMVSRLGTSESCVLLNHLEIKAASSCGGLAKFHHRLQGQRVSWDAQLIRQLASHAGVFPPDEHTAAAFAERFLVDLGQADLMGVWSFVPGEDYLLSRFCPGATRFQATAVEPYYFVEPWSAHLASKRVLVVHPFAETIEKQYRKNRAAIFPGTSILPEFELTTLRAVQSLAGNRTKFANWLEALAWMECEIARKDFDVALIGAGGYGLPLAAHVKRLGKVAIHLGGALQILFGIKGRRWDNMPAIAKFYNEHWVRPSASEQIPSAEKIEGGCYW